MYSIAHFHMRLDFNIKCPRDFKRFYLKLVLLLHWIQLKNYKVLKSSEPVILTFNLLQVLRLTGKL